MGSADSSMSKVAVCTGFGAGHSGFLTPSHSIAPGTFCRTNEKPSAPIAGRDSKTAAAPTSHPEPAASCSAIYGPQAGGGWLISDAILIGARRPDATPV